MGTSLLRWTILLPFGFLLAGCARSPEMLPPAPSPSPPGSVNIQIVVYGGNSPLQNVQVELYRGQFVPVPGELAAEAVTDERGIANLTVAEGTYGFWVRALDLSAQWQYKGPLSFTFTKDEVIRVRMLPAD